MPDFTRSRISSRSNSAMLAKMPKTSLPFGVLVSTPSCSEINSIPSERNSSRAFISRFAATEIRSLVRRYDEGGSGRGEARDISGQLFFPRRAILIAIVSRIFRSLSLVRLKNCRNRASVLAARPELPHPSPSAAVRFGNAGALDDPWPSLKS